MNVVNAILQYTSPMYPPQTNDLGVMQTIYLERGGSVGFTSSGFLDSFYIDQIRMVFELVYSKLGVCEDESKSTHIITYSCPFIIHMCFQSEMIYKRMETASVQWAVETVATQGGHTTSQQEPLKIPWKK